MYWFALGCNAIGSGRCQIQVKKYLYLLWQKNKEEENEI